MLNGEYGNSNVGSDKNASNSNTVNNAGNNITEIVEIHDEHNPDQHNQFHIENNNLAYILPKADPPPPNKPRSSDAQSFSLTLDSSNQPQSEKLRQSWWEVFISSWIKFPFMLMGLFLFTLAVHAKTPVENLEILSSWENVGTWGLANLFGGTGFTAEVFILSWMRLKKETNFSNTKIVMLALGMWAKAITKAYFLFLVFSVGATFINLAPENPDRPAYGTLFGARATIGFGVPWILRGLEDGNIINYRTVMVLSFLLTALQYAFPFANLVNKELNNSVDSRQMGILDFLILWLFAPVIACCLAFAVNSSIKIGVDLFDKMFEIVKKLIERNNNLNINAEDSHSDIPEFN